MSGEEATPIVTIAYAAKSTEDAGGSIGTQITAISEAVEREGERELVVSYSDESVSAYSKSRGSGLERARTHAEELVREGQSVELWVAHSDRLARGDGKQAAHLIEHMLWSRKSDVRLRSVGDDHSLGDLLHAVVTGERNFEDSNAKSQHVRRGKRKRFEDGGSTGPVNYGYMLAPRLDADEKPVTKRDGRIIYERIPDPERRQHVERIFAMAEQGHTHGEITRALNADGIPTKRGGTWSRPTIRRMLRDPYYAGKVRMHGELRDGDHEPIIESERFERLQAKLARRDPVKQRQRRGGRPSKNADYLLRGLLSCARCGHGLYVRDLVDGRTYICGSVREQRGTCVLPIIDADLIEKPTLLHLRGRFGINLKAWIEDRMAERDQALRALDARLDRERAELAERERKTEKAKTNVADLIAERPELAAGALEALETVAARAVEQFERVRAVEAELAEHDATVTADELMRRVEAMHALVEGQLGRAKDAAELNTALRGLLAVATVDVTDERGIVLHFELAGSPHSGFEFIGTPEHIRADDETSVGARERVREALLSATMNGFGSAEGKPERTPSSANGRQPESC